MNADLFSSEIVSPMPIRRTSSYDDLRIYNAKPSPFYMVMQKTCAVCRRVLPVAYVDNLPRYCSVVCRSLKK